MVLNTQYTGDSIRYAAAYSNQNQAALATARMPIEQLWHELLRVEYWIFQALLESGRAAIESAYQLGTL